MWTQRLLYLDSGIRHQVQEALEVTAEEEGLLLSGFSIRSLTHAQFTVQHRAHARGKDALRCFDIQLPSLTRTTCSVSS
ncbi:hypothetical protein COU76_00175 [Candidatus Peregrinibacteria bacterium CG10_big_fil_rev_8_21_14_0_10_49_10]|nr:MAG: hypothetical protein COU76_00175 [Candidatus Peregrinibacteria bacterium CG10_big_fil_rev_8_21_14_0_10_49_10]